MIYGLLLFVLMGLGLPIAIALISIAFAFFLFSSDIDPLIVAQRVATGVDSFPLLAIPFFMLAAEFMNRAGVTDRIFRLAKCLVGSLPGGLGHVNVLASMIFAGMSGSAVADAGGLGKIEIRAMKRDGYDPEFCAALTAASATIGPIIPPSISMVIYGLASGASIGGLFLGGMVPGIMMAMSLMTLVWYISVRRDYGTRTPSSLANTLDALRQAFLPLLTPILIVGGILGGIFTPTEAGAMGVLYSFLLGKYVYRNIHWRQLPDILLQTATSAGNILFIIAATASLSWIMTLEELPAQLAESIVSVSAKPWLLLLMLNGLLILLGCFMAAAPVIIMLTPVLLPAATQIGIHPIHLGVVMVVNLMIGLITPPVGLCLFVVSDVADVPVGKVIRALVPFYIPLCLVQLLITLCPDLVLFLPRLWGLA